NVLEGRFDLLQCGVVGREKTLYSSNDKAALTGLSVLEFGKEICQVSTYLMGMAHQFVVFDQTMGAVIAGDSDGKHHQSGEHKSGSHLLSESPVAKHLLAPP